jgi:transglutaminase-like putative cysteine protease
MSRDMQRFLHPSSGIQSDHPEILALAQSTASGAADQVEAAARLFVFTRDTVAYSPHSPFYRLEHYLALNTLERGRGYCVQKAVLLCTLARALGIPARLGFAHIRNLLLPEGFLRMLGNDIMCHHCFTELFLEGRWLKQTPAFDAKLSQERGWRVVEFNPQGDALLPETDLKGRPHIVYQEDLGWREGVPLQEILQSWRDHYTDQRVDSWIAALEAGKPFPMEAAL